MFYIYCIEIIPTGKKYVGCTSNVLRRWKQHTKNYGDTKVGQAIKSAGISNISVNVLDLHDDIKDALASEQSFIQNLNTLEPNGYNQNGGRPPTVDYERKRRLHIPMSDEAFQLLEKAVAMETGRRYPERVDKGLIVEYAIREYCKKHKII